MCIEIKEYYVQLISSSSKVAQARSKVVQQSTIMRKSCENRPRTPPKSTQDRPGAPQSAPKAPQSDPRAPQSVPTAPISTPRAPKRSPRTPRSVPKAAQSVPKIAQKCPKSAQKCPKSTQKRPRSTQKETLESHFVEKAANLENHRQFCVFQTFSGSQRRPNRPQRAQNPSKIAVVTLGRPPKSEKEHQAHPEVLQERPREAPWGPKAPRGGPGGVWPGPGWQAR